MMNLKNSVYWNLFSEVWSFFKRYVDVKETDDFWDEVIKASGDVYKKYDGQPEGEFAKRLTLDVVEELHQIYLRRKEGESESFHLCANDKKRIKMSEN